MNTAAPTNAASTGVTGEHNAPAASAAGSVTGAQAQNTHAGQTGASTKAATGDQGAKKQEGTLANTGVSNETAGAVLAASGLAAAAGGASIMVARRNKKA